MARTGSVEGGYRSVALRNGGARLAVSLDDGPLEQPQRPLHTASHLDRREQPLPLGSRGLQAPPHGAAHLPALPDIVSPEEHPLAQLTFDFPQADLPQAASRIEAFFLQQTPLTLRPGSMIRFVLLNPAELFIPGWQVVRVAHRFVLTPEGTVKAE